MPFKNELSRDIRDRENSLPLPPDERGRKVELDRIENQI
jgi:hypothetical protein